ncbi:hypothetical protein [Nocardia testacea]|uniref:hypothetical protein n=1 Tax=Nocardia testacea TaxID=248551 RepID=UPI0033F5FA16
MSSRTEIPPELAEWVEKRAELLLANARRIGVESDVRQGQPAREWLLALLDDLAAVESIAKRSVHLLTAYALRTGAASATEVARATDVTVTAATNRGASKIARETWAEVWPESAR